jgi:hypothetical protein
MIRRAERDGIEEAEGTRRRGRNMDKSTSCIGKIFE